MKKNQRVDKIKPVPSSNYIFWILLGVIMLLTAIIRLRLLSIPLERDEGEYAYFGQLILQGIPPYQIAYNMKFPGTYFMYAIIMSIFGETTESIHLGLLIVNLASILLLFLLVKKLIGNYAALVAASAFAFLSLSYSVFGFAGHATHFVILAAIAGSLMLLKAMKEKNKVFIFLSGILLGLAPIMKQPGIFFCLFGEILLIMSFSIHRNESIKSFITRLLFFSFGITIPFTFMVVILKLWGVFDKFWFWTVQYASEYENQLQLKDVFANFKMSFDYVIQGFYLIWIIAAIGIGILFIHSKIRKTPSSLFILLFFVFSFLSICPGLYFRQHYFITLLPAIAILFGISIDYLLELSNRSKKLKLLKYISYGLFVIPIALGLNAQKNYFFKTEPTQLSRKIYGLNPFPESVEIAKYIEANSNKDDKIAIFGSEPQIFFYANRHSATGYIYTYSLMEKHKNSLKMQKEMISEIEAALPKFFIFVNISTSWLVRTDSEMYIFNWINNYLQKYQYQLKGTVDLYSGVTIYKWNNEALNYKPESSHFVQIFERKM